MRRVRPKLVNVLLSALVVAWGIVPPGIQHAHDGGSDVTHRHDGIREVVHHRAHDRRAHDHGTHDHGTHDHDSNDEGLKQANVTDVSLLTDGTPHIHWQFLGLEFSVPAPEEPVDHDNQAVALATTVLAIDGLVLTTQAGPSFIRALLLGIYTPNADVVQNLRQVPRPPNLVTSIPLCDAARRERTGVLLA